MSNFSRSFSEWQLSFSQRALSEVEAAITKHSGEGARVDVLSIRAASLRKVLEAAKEQPENWEAVEALGNATKQAYQAMHELTGTLVRVNLYPGWLGKALTGDLSSIQAA